MRPVFPPPHPQVLPAYVQPPRRSVLPLLTGLFGMIAAGLTLGGSFAPVREVDSGDNGYVIKWWGVDRPDFAADTDTLAGLTLVLATVLLGVGAVLAFTRVTAAARLFLALGTGSLAGTVLLQLIYTLDDMNMWNDVPLQPGESIRFTAGWGLWLPLTGLVFGVVAVVLAFRGGPARVEPNTPRMGFPMPYGPPVPGAATPPGAVAAAPIAGSTAPTPPTGIPAAPAVSPVAVAVPVTPPAPPAPAAPSVPDDDPDETLRTTVSEAPTEVPAPAAPGASAAAAMVPEPPAAEEIASALTPAPVAPDAPTEVPRPDPEEWTAADVDAPPEPAPDAPTEVPPAESDTEPAPLDPAAAESAEPPADATPAAEPAPESAEAPDAPAPADAEPAAENPEPGASGLSGLPAAPPAPELADGKEDR